MTGVTWPSVILWKVAEPSESLLVFSDVHLGSDLDDCQGHAPKRSSVDRDLVALVAHYRQTPPKASRWHIVVAGDFIDFIGMAITPPSGELTGQLTELTEERERARVQGRTDRLAELDAEIATLQDDLADTAEKIVTEVWHEAEVHAPHPI